MRNVNYITVTVAPYVHGREGGRTYGTSAKFDVYTTSDDLANGEANALREAKPFCHNGLCVIVRPRYNHGNSLCYKEWRSFNGGEFEKVVFHLCGNTSGCEA